MRRPLRSDEARAIANLAIDLGDPGRMAKARRLHRSGSVSAIDVESGAAHASVTDADGEIYDVTITVVAPPAQELPMANDLLAECSCDDTGDACRHGLAAMLGIAEEVEADVRVIDRWTGAEAPPKVATYESPGSGAEAFFAGAWTNNPPVASVARLSHTSRASALVVDGIDAHPVIVDASAAIADGLSHVRS